MFTDSRLSIELSSQFKESLAVSSDSEGFPDVSFNILTSTYWPFTKSDSTCILPHSLSKVLEKFESFYMVKHSGRQLSWLKNMGTGDVVAYFGGKKKELNMSTFCMVVLMLCFNHPENNAVSFERVKILTGIPPDDAKRALQSLSMGKYRLLLKSGTKGKDVVDSDTFTVNTNFQCPLSKIKILSISSSSSTSNTTHITTSNGTEDTKERIATLAKIAEQRKYQIEAAIVRIMKSRKTLDHNNLVAQVIELLSSRFLPDISMVKQRIEGLIERDYLERDENNR